MCFCTLPFTNEIFFKRFSELFNFSRMYRKTPMLKVKGFGKRIGCADKPPENSGQSATGLF
jgi:hypothetical protein